MRVDFTNLDLKEKPLIILKNASGEPIGTLGRAFNISVDIKYNETSMIEFDIPKEADGEATPFYDMVIGMRIVDLCDIGQFILMNPVEHTEGGKIIKSCKGYSLEYEFTYKRITLENSTYNFWNPTTPDATIMGIVMKLMPSWRIGYIDDNLVGKYRTYEVSDENLYNFLKDTIQTSYGCIFEFDTYTRTVNAISTASKVAEQPIFISNLNLGKSLSIEENTEDIVTRLDVNGAEGVGIREVNPTGTNQIINLDYFMNTSNFSQDLIDKYYNWQSEFDAAQRHYYNLSILYALRMTSIATEEAKLKELEEEQTSIENELAVALQAIAAGLGNQSDVQVANNKLQGKIFEISNQKSVVQGIRLQAEQILSEMKSINNALAFEKYFTEEEQLQFDKYLKDSSVSESSFVLRETKSYEDEDLGLKLTEGSSVEVYETTATYISTSSGGRIYDMTGGKINSNFTSGTIISAVLEVESDGRTFMFTAYMANGQSIGNASDTDTSHAFPRACISLTGTLAESISSDVTGDQVIGKFVSFSVKDGYLYFTMDTSEYERRYVAWDLYNYGKDILEKISQPSFKFEITSGNFLCLDDFVKFKNALELGKKVYVALNDDSTLSPICIGVKFSYENISDLVLEFGNSYTSRDTSFLLADLLEQSVSMGKNIDLSKYNYSAFIDSGASTNVRDFMNAALDVSKNAIISSKEQAISWGDSGIRLRKWRNEAKTEYDPKQVWMNNNCIMMTKDNWSSAEIAIGNFYDENLGECWGIVAPNIVGTLLAGNNLVIESVKQDGGVAVFKVDAEGCFLHNSNISVTSDSTNSQILLNPEHGIMIGKYPLIGNDGTVNSANRTFYADSNGNLTLKGTIYAENGEFTGKVTATEGYIGYPGMGWTITTNGIYNGKPSLVSDSYGIYIGTDGISLGSSSYGSGIIQMNANGSLTASNATIMGNIFANGGIIGGCSIYNGVLQVSDANITNISASKITAGTLDCSDIYVTNLSANSITTGTINGYLIEDLDASKITSGVFSEDRIPYISANKIYTGYLSADRIYGGTLRGCEIEIGDYGGLSNFRVSNNGMVLFRVNYINVIDEYNNVHSVGQTRQVRVVSDFNPFTNEVTYTTLKFVAGFYTSLL